MLEYHSHIALLIEARGTCGRTACSWSILQSEVIGLRKFVCPSCSEVSCSVNDQVSCQACGDQMARIDGSLHVSVPDKPGALAEFLKTLAEREINVTALRVIARRSEEAHVLFSVDRVDTALEIPGVKRAEDVAYFAGVACIG